MNESFCLSVHALIQINRQSNVII